MCKRLSSHYTNLCLKSAYGMSNVPTWKEIFNHRDLSEGSKSEAIQNGQLMKLITTELTIFPMWITRFQRLKNMGTIKF